MVSERAHHVVEIGVVRKHPKVSGAAEDDEGDGLGCDGGRGTDREPLGQ